MFRDVGGTVLALGVPLMGTVSVDGFPSQSGLLRQKANAAMGAPSCTDTDRRLFRPAPGAGCESNEAAHREITRKSSRAILRKHDPYVQFHAENRNQESLNVTERTEKTIMS